jgi:hypothetical protein
MSYMRGCSARRSRVKIWSRDLRVVYLDDPELIGRAFPSSHELEDALDGQIVSEVSDLTKEENVGDRSYGKLLEVYVPLTFPGDPAPAGAFELHLPYLSIEAAVAPDVTGCISCSWVAWPFSMSRCSVSSPPPPGAFVAKLIESFVWQTRSAIWPFGKPPSSATVSHEFRTPLTIIEVSRAPSRDTTWWPETDTPCWTAFGMPAIDCMTWWRTCSGQPKGSSARLKWSAGPWP